MIILLQATIMAIQVTRSAATAARRISAQDPFWLTVELRNVDFVPGCLTAAGCAEPRFKILISNLISNERQSISWAQQGNGVKEQPSREFVSAWHGGSSAEIAISCQVAGTDPLYGFPRTCDQSAMVKAFDTKASRLPSQDDEHDERHLVEIMGKCFNATLTVKSHEDRCPWCVDHKHVFIEDREPEAMAAKVDVLGDPLQMSVVVLATCAILTTSAFAWLLILYLKQQRRLKREIRIPGAAKPGKTYEARPVAHRPDHLRRVDEAKYDVPWTENAYRTIADTHYRTLPYYSVGNSQMPLIRATRIPPPPPMMEATALRGVSIGPVKDSPNSSMGDSGVDSGYSGARNLW